MAFTISGLGAQLRVTDDGGVTVPATVTDPPAGGVLVSVELSVGVERPCYSGAIGQGNLCVPDGDALAWVMPPLPVGGPYKLWFRSVDGLTTTSYTGVIVERRSYSTTLYSLRSQFPPLRSVGPPRIQDEVRLGEEVGVNEAFVSAVAEALLDVGGYLLTRTTAVTAAGATSLPVQSTYRWPEPGTAVIEGKVYSYASTTDLTLDGLSPPLAVEVPNGAVVQEWSRSVSMLDKLRAQFLLPRMAFEEAEVAGRNIGISRPVGAPGTLWGRLLQVIGFAPAQAMPALCDALDVIFGPTGYSLWEDLEREPFTLFLSVPLIGGGPVGRAYFVGGEAAPRLTGLTVGVDYPPVLVYGIYADSDPDRVGTNYAELPVPGCTTSALDPDRVTSPGNVFTPADVGKWIIWPDGSYWRIITRVSATQVDVDGAPARTDGSTLDTAPAVLRTEGDWWRPWMVGHAVQVTSTVPGNSGTYAIARVIDAFSVELTGAAFENDLSVTWQLHPQLPTATVSIRFLKATVVGTTITAPVTLPVNCLVDYATAPSAQLVANAEVAGGAQRPLYLYDPWAPAIAILDLITAAGVRVVAAYEEV